MASLDEFRHLTMAQLKLFFKAISEEHERAALERKANERVQAAQGRTPNIRVVG